MSVASMARLAAQAGVQETERRQPRMAGDQPGPGSVAGAVVTAQTDPTSVQGALESIAAYIPSEALAVYIAAVGVFQPKGNVEPWFWLLVGIGAVVFFGWLAGMDRNVPTPRDKLMIVIVLALVSFVTYAGALPGSPFTVIDARATAAAGILALALSFALPRIARILKVAPTTT
jgi:hypothetical protein